MNRLKSLRKAKGMKQSELGELLNVQDAAISKYESGKIPLTGDTLMKLSEIFNVSVDYLLGGTENEEESYASLGDKIAKQRKKLGLSQEELAEKLNISRSTLAGYEAENKKPSYKVLVRMAEYFGVSVDYLLGMPEPEPEPDIKSISERGDGRPSVMTIKQFRESIGQTQEEFATIIKVSKVNYSKKENGKVKFSLNEAFEIANHFNKSIDDIFGNIEVSEADYLLGMAEPEPDIKSYLAGNLKILREQENLSQLEFAERFNVNRSTVGNWENGVRRPEIEMIMRIADYYGVSLDRLISQDISNAGGENMRLAENMRFLRAQKGINQRQFADEMGVSNAAVGMWEQARRNPELPMLIAIAEFYGVTLDELVLKEMKPPVPLYASNLSYLRKKHNMTQQDVAELIGYSGKQGYNNIENGKAEPSISQFSKLADFFGVTIDQIVKEDLTQEVSE